MNYALSHLKDVNETTLEQDIVTFGQGVFRRIGQNQPSTFNKKYWNTKLMEWSMQRPAFKTNLFRLVDVLPTLKSSSAIADHITQYLAKEGAEIHALIGWALKIPERSLRAPLASLIVKKSVNEMANQFIAGSTPDTALKPLKKMRRNRIAFTADLLGEFCVSEEEAIAYLQRYLDALDVFAKEIPHWNEAKPIIAGHPGEQSPICISVKLTALYSQCSVLNFERTVSVLSERLTVIAQKAKSIGALLYVDAEDCGNNPMIYETFKQVFGSQEFKDFPYPGIVVQAYALGAEAIIQDLLAFARARGAPIAIRLVKGAYWDHETIIAKQNFWPSPLFAHKESSDANYEHLSRILIDNHTLVLPAFGSHNIRSLSHALCYARQRGLSEKDVELQMLYGMADPIVNAFTDLGYLVRLYVPLGEMLPGMGYLVRRLLENTSNESFLRHTFFDNEEVSALLRKPNFKG